ncbi:hypothetical protein [Streptomyces solicathayae]|uniref:DUF2207 domain-containing protein n=1 Tax=Streptomyces solicathayae TaxID=3081768 RepID=A0ABZ0M249_9ACTN|nr:hypothetical protein [Streptomyces sp. HUAS YS2]WOX25797.1 hypothetical protein R2D22_32215 [Streptomyces sp. HUAS YS2]
MSLFLLVLVIAIALGIIGAVADGLLYLLFIGIVLFVVDLLLLGSRFTRRSRAHR